MGNRSRQSLEARFWPQMNRTDTCWLWKGFLHNGYGHIRDKNWKIQLAHRVAYELLVGPIPVGLTIDHLCHNTDDTCKGGSTCPHRECVNPAHLEPVTKRRS